MAKFTDEAEGEAPELHNEANTDAQPRDTGFALALLLTVVFFFFCGWAFVLGVHDAEQPFERGTSRVARFVHELWPYQLAFWLTDPYPDRLSDCKTSPDGELEICWEGDGDVDLAPAPKGQHDAPACGAGGCAYPNYETTPPPLICKPKGKCKSNFEHPDPADIK